LGHGPTRTPSPLAGFWRCCVKRRPVRPQDMCRSRLMLPMVRNVPMPMRVGDDLPAGRRVRSWPGTCRCRRRSTPGTGPLGPTNRWSLLSRQHPVQGPSHPRQAVPLVLTTATNRSAAKSLRSHQLEAVR